MDQTTAQLREDMGRRIADFICRELEWEGNPEALLGQDARSLPEELDSTQLLELAGFVEDEYGVSLDDDEITAEIFGSVDVLVTLVLDKSGRRQAD